MTPFQFVAVLALALVAVLAAAMAWQLTGAWATTGDRDAATGAGLALFVETLAVVAFVLAVSWFAP